MASNTSFSSARPVSQIQPSRAERERGTRGRPVTLQEQKSARIRIQSSKPKLPFGFPRVVTGQRFATGKRQTFARDNIDTRISKKSGLALKEPTFVVPSKGQKAKDNKTVMIVIAVIAAFFVAKKLKVI